MITGKIKSKYILNDVRFNSGYFLNEDAVYSRTLEENKNKCTTLDEMATVWNPPIFKRQFCQKTERAIPYCQSSDVTNALEGSDVYINKIQATKVGSVVEKNQILVTGFGTIGNTRLINELSSGISYANNCCRIQANEDQLYGYLYAMMSSKYGRSQLNKNASGSVVRYIEAPGFKKTLIPILPYLKQQEIHNLIVEASNLRVEANKLLKEAMEYFNSLKIDYKYGTATSRKISISGISNGYKRFDSAYAIVSKLVENSLQSNQIDYVTIRSQSSGIFIGPRAKRNYVTSGTPFLSTSAMQKANPTKVDKYISPKSSDGFIVEEGWILTTRSGTLGDTIYTLPCISGFAVSEDAIRVVLKEDAQISNEYLFAFLKSSIGRSSLLSGSYGSVILHLNENYIGDIKVPILAKEIIEEIVAKVGQHLKNMNEAILKENQAIDLVEKEIESWQK
jgi:restriction endonuclease S subunit